MTGSWKKLCNEELHNLYMHEGDEKYITILVGKGRDLMKEQGIDGRMILKLILETQVGKGWTEFI